MQRIVMATKAGGEEPWLADAAAELAEQSGAAVSVVSLDGLDSEALAPLPRAEYADPAQQAVDRTVARLAEHGIAAEGVAGSGPVVRGILVFAEERDADLIVCGASSRRPVARRILGSVPMQLVDRSRRPVLVITPS